MATQAPSLRPSIKVFTDGSCLGNPGPGGWAALLRYGRHEKIVTGASSEKTTNNRMELMAVIVALESLKNPCQVDLVSDSTYVLNGLKACIDARNVLQGTRYSDKPDQLEMNGISHEEPDSFRGVANADLWKRLANLTKNHEIACQWVKAHSGHPDNERVDRLAKTSARSVRSTLPSSP